jgi:hypothetical protein
MRALAIILGLGLIAGLLFSGCARKQTYNTPGGKVTVAEKGGGANKKVTVESKAGKMEMEMGDKTATVTTEKGTMKMNKGISEAELKIPFYPGGEVGESMTMSGDTMGKGGEMKQVTMTTADSVDKVKAFYLKKYPKANNMVMNNADGEYTQMVVEEGKEQRFINITRKKGDSKTTLVLHYMSQ